MNKSEEAIICEMLDSQLMIVVCEACGEEYLDEEELCPHCGEENE